MTLCVVHIWNGLAGMGINSIEFGSSFIKEAVLGKLLMQLIFKYVDSIPSYPGTLGPEGARISEIPVTQGKT